MHDYLSVYSELPILHKNCWMYSLAYSILLSGPGIVCWTPDTGRSAWKGSWTGTNPWNNSSTTERFLMYLHNTNSMSSSISERIILFSRAIFVVFAQIIILAPWQKHHRGGSDFYNSFSWSLLSTKSGLVVTKRRLKLIAQEKYRTKFSVMRNTVSDFPRPKILWPCSWQTYT